MHTERRLAALFGGGRLSRRDSTSSDEALEDQDCVPRLATCRAPHSSTGSEQGSSGDERTVATLRPRWAAPLQPTVQGNRPTAGRQTNRASLPRWAARQRFTSSSSAEDSGGSTITAMPCGSAASAQGTPPWMRWARRCALSSSDSSGGASPAASPSPNTSPSPGAASPCWASPPWQSPAHAKPSTAQLSGQRTVQRSRMRAPTGPRRSLAGELERAAGIAQHGLAEPGSGPVSSPPVFAVLPLLVPPDLGARFNLVPAGPADWKPAGPMGSPAAASAHLNSWLLPAVAAALSQAGPRESASPGQKGEVAGGGSWGKPATHRGAGEPSFSFQQCGSRVELQQGTVGSWSKTEEPVADGEPAAAPGAQPPSFWSRLFCRAASGVKA